MDRETEADKANDRKSLRRRLDERLYLILQRKEDGKWEFPTGVHQEGESLSQCASRQLQLFGKQFQANIVSFMPQGVLELAYDRVPVDDQPIGLKTFFYRCILINGKPVIDSEKYKDHLWVTKAELPEFFDIRTDALLQKMLWNSYPV